MSMDDTKPPKVTIIIPAYKDWESLCTCLTSCDRHVNHPHEIIVVNDASPEDGFEQKIKDFIHGKQKFRHYLNEENLGFVKSCNKGVELATSDNDILLLNSDTEVTSGFLEEMLFCLYDSDRHGVCCPRSNNATLVSVPFFYTGSRHDKGYPALSFSAWQNIKGFMPRHHVIPTGQGFCMLIKRQLITNFGLFDEIYRAGYNEENDFCCRINRHGYSAVAANHAFVFHLETKSFSAEQKNLLESRNRKILDQRYPEYENAVSYYFNWDTPAFERFADIAGGCYAKKKVLFDLTRLISQRNGTSEHVLSLLEALYPKASVAYDFYISVNSAANDYFNLSERFNNVLINDTFELPFRFDLIYVPNQIFEYENLFMINRFGIKYIVDILDIICVRSNYLRNKDIKHIFRTAMMYADGLLVNSETVWRDIQNFFQFTLRAHQQVLPMHISKSSHQENDFELSPAELEIAESLPEDFVLIIGNSHYYHKALAVTLKNIQGDYPVVVLGAVADDDKSIACKKNIVSIKNGGLTDNFIALLHTKCKCILYPSQYEGFGLTILSAILYGKPIVLFNSEINREVTAQYEDKGLFFFFDHFNQIDPIISAINTRHGDEKWGNSLRLDRGWDTVAQETISYIDRVLAAPLDPEWLENRNNHILQLELLYKTGAAKIEGGYAGDYTEKKSKTKRFREDLPKAWNVIKKRGVLNGLARVYWYVRGVRMPDNV